MAVTRSATSRTGTIVNDDEANIGIDDVVQLEGDTGDSPYSLFTFTVSMSSGGAPAVAAEDVTMMANTSAGTATAGTDYVSIVDQTVTIAAGSSTATVTVEVVGDQIVEGIDETFFVDLADPKLGGAVNALVIITDDQGDGTILDDDTVLDVGDVIGYREFHWVSVPVLLKAEDIQALLVEIHYGPHLDFLDDEDDAVKVLDETRITVSAGDEDFAGTQVVWDDDEYARVMYFVIYDPTGGTAISLGNTDIVSLKFRVRPGAPVWEQAGDELALTVIKAESLMIDPSGDTMAFAERGGSVSVDTQQRGADLDEDGDADPWDGLWGYRASMLDLLGYGEIMTAAMREAHGTNYISDDEMRANYRELATKRGAEAHAPFDSNEDDLVTPGKDGVNWFRYFANGGGPTAEGKNDDPDSVPDSRDDPGGPSEGAIEDVVNPNLTALATEGADAETPHAGPTLAREDASRGGYVEVVYDEALYQGGTATLVDNAFLATAVTSVTEQDTGDVTATCTFEVSSTRRSIRIYRTAGNAFIGGKQVTVTIDETKLEDVADRIGTDNARAVQVTIPDPNTP